MKKPFYIGLALAVILVVGGAYLFNNPYRTALVDKGSFANQKKAAHFESSVPEHAAVLAGVPINVVVDSNFDFSAKSSLSITNNDKEYGVGDSSIDENLLVLRRAMNKEAPDGLYTVNYKACWADGSCHDGNFQFKIDRSTAATYEDLRGQKEVEIDMAAIQFKPKNIRISQGTQVIWKNSDTVEHFVNTDSHPAHTYYAAQNSRTLKKDARFSTTFTEVGIYPYHCSAHAATMVGAILVES